MRQILQPPHIFAIDVRRDAAVMPGLQAYVEAHNGSVGILRSPALRALCGYRRKGKGYHLLTFPLRHRGNEPEYVFVPKEDFERLYSRAVIVPLAEEGLSPQTPE